MSNLNRVLKKDLQNVTCSHCSKALARSKGPLICTSCAKRVVEEESEFYKRVAEDTMQMRMQKIQMGDESRAALVQAAAKPKCPHPGCTRDVFRHLGMCADHHRCWEPTSDYKRRRAAFIERSIHYNHGHDICMCGQPHSTHGDYTGCMTTWGYLTQHDEYSRTYTTRHPTTNGYTDVTITEEEKRYSQILQEPDDPRPWFSRRCTENGCKMDGYEDYGFLCRDHYYEHIGAERDAGLRLPWKLFAKHDKRRWVKELPGMATLASIVYVPMFAAGILFGWPYIVASWGVLCAGVLGNQTELGLVQGWKRANKPRIPTKGAAKTKPFELPSV